MDSHNYTVVLKPHTYAWPIKFNAIFCLGWAVYIFRAQSGESSPQDSQLINVQMHFLRINPTRTALFSIPFPPTQQWWPLQTIFRPCCSYNSCITPTHNLCIRFSVSICLVAIRPSIRVCF